MSCLGTILVWAGLIALLIRFPFLWWIVLIIIGLALIYAQED